MATKTAHTAYSNNSAEAMINHIAFSQKEGLTYATMRIDAAADIEQLLGGLPISPVSSIPTEVGGKELVCRVYGAPELLVGKLAERGESLEQQEVKGKGKGLLFFRGCTSIVGQSLQLLSGGTTVDNGLRDMKGNLKPDDKGNPIRQPKAVVAAEQAAAVAEAKDAGISNVPDAKPYPNKWNGISPDVGMFAVLNLMANASNMTFGSQHKIDPRHTLMLKEQFNEQIRAIAGDELELPDPNSKAMDRRPPEQLTLGEKAYKLGQKYSVTIGEVGLRMLGTTALIIPANTWMPALKKLATLDPAGAVQELKLNPDQATLMVGLGTMVGKLSSLVAKEHDPYNPKEQTWFDKFRTDWAFKASSVIEGGAAAYMTYDRLKNKKSTLGYKGDLKDYNHEDNYNDLQCDWAGALGNAVFVGGYVIRYPAPVGTLDVDMPELYAHISDGLAQLPAYKIPDILEGTAISLKEHFKNDPELTVADIYAGIMHELETHHGVVLPTIAERAQMVVNGVADAGENAQAARINMNVRPPREQAPLDKAFGATPINDVQQSQYMDRVSTMPEVALSV